MYCSLVYLYTNILLYPYDKKDITKFINVFTSFLLKIDFCKINKKLNEKFLIFKERVCVYFNGILKFYMGGNII